MSHIAVFVIGVVIGWVIFEKPQWAKDAVAWFSAKVGSWRS